MVVLKENCCRFCAKVFCCSDCRESHESSKHPKPKCSLCIRDILQFNAKDDKTTDLFCHIVFNHLPLHCKLCGIKYTNNQELTDAEPCRWWAKQRAPKEAQLARETNNSSPTLAAARALSKLEIICEENLPRTPEFSAGEGANKPLRAISDPSSLTRLKQEHFDSPPELVRHTSTPVHGALLLPGPKPTDTSDSLPQFLLKTPSSAELKYPFNSTASTVGSAGSRTGSDTESRYYTGLTSIADSQFEREKETEADPSSWNTPGARKQQQQQQQQQQQPDSNPPSAEASRRIERSILKPEAWSRVNESSRGDSIEKRVRFSDQCRAPADAAGMDNESSAYFADNDIFFEACESLDEVAPEAKEAAPKDVAKNYRRDEDDAVQCLPSSTVDCNDDDKHKVFKVEEGKAQSSPDSSTGDKESNKPTSSTSNSSSRVLMMLLVEKTDSKGLSALDLAPLIDTGLKKLEESVGSVNNNSKIIKGSHQNPSNSGDSVAATSTTRRLSQVASYSRTVDGSVSDEGGKGSVRASIKNSFVSISDRIECFTSTPARQPSTSAETAEPTEMALVSLPKPDGIFSAMARVVRSALQKLPAVGTRNLSREPIPQSEHSASENSLSAMEALSIGGSRSTVVAGSAGSCALQAASQAVQLSSRSTVVAGSAGSCALQAASQAVQLSSKRPRERLDSAEEPATSRDSPGSAGSSGSNNQQVVLSPVAKRPRGWYRIRAREPIARMRQITSPRGASREVQRFQQGSLTVGDTLLPLPSRAHQSTQTEN